MAKLTPDQQKAVAQWAAEGANLNEIQGRLKSEYDLTITYLDARILVMELGLKLQEKKKDTPPEEKKTPAPPAEELSDEAVEPDVLPPQSPAGAGKVTIVIDQITVPGAMISGKVTFSDGKTATWYVDQSGRLGMKAPDPTYKPPAADIPIFQRDLDLALQRAGF